MPDCGWCDEGWPLFEYDGFRWHSVPEPMSQVPCEVQSTEEGKIEK